MLLLKDTAQQTLAKVEGFKNGFFVKQLGLSFLFTFTQAGLLVGRRGPELWLGWQSTLLFLQSGFLLFLNQSPATPYKGPL